MNLGKGLTLNEKVITAIMKRDVRMAFSNPTGYVFVTLFIFLSAAAAFWQDQFFQNNLANLEQLNTVFPYLLLFFIPALTMGVWAEETKQGTDELLLTLPVRLITAVLAKFLAAWAFIAVALVLTFPMIFTVHYLGEPDNGPIVAGYLGSLLMAGAYLAVASCTSALTKNQVISFIISVVICLVLVLLGWGVMSEALNTILPVWLTDLIAQFSFTTHFEALRRGVIDLRDLVYFLSVIGFMLLVNVVVLESRKAS